MFNVTQYDSLVVFSALMKFILPAFKRTVIWHRWCADSAVEIYKSPPGYLILPQTPTTAHQQHQHQLHEVSALAKLISCHKTPPFRVPVGCNQLLYFVGKIEKLLAHNN